ncbi:MAG: fumarylacetoacetate hydrolase family protein [Microbacteriaceae bacterium]|nr:fumarylacetoacetate hydrolase family protein [Microbacteriaceae bacterium]
MKLATIRTPGGTAVVRIDGDTAVEIPGVADVGELLATVGVAGAAEADGVVHTTADLDYAPLVTSPGKIICVGLNYRAHILETKRDFPAHPTLFAKFADCLIGANDDIVIPVEDTKDIDWEGELVIVIGQEVRRARGAEAEAAIAGYSAANDVSMRDWQYRSTQWDQGKFWEASTPVGPVLATRDEIPFQARITTTVNGEVKQEGEIHDLVFGPAALVEYVSTITTLRPGDLILTGTPGGVGHVKQPPEFMAPGDTVTIAIDGIGSLTNVLVAG